MLVAMARSTTLADFGLKPGPVTRAFQFDDFFLQPARQLLMHGGVPVRIGGRAFDLLTALVERPGELLSKQDLMARAWPDTFVEESNLKVNMAGLRRALGDRSNGPRFIATIVGRGYRFVAPVRSSEQSGWGETPILTGERHVPAEIGHSVEPVRELIAAR